MLLLGVGDLPKLLARPEPMFGEPLGRCFRPGLLSVVRKSNRTGAWPGLELEGGPLPIVREVVN